MNPKCVIEGCGSDIWHVGSRAEVSSGRADAVPTEIGVLCAREHLPLYDKTRKDRAVESCTDLKHRREVIRNGMQRRIAALSAGSGESAH